MNVKYRNPPSVGHHYMRLPICHDISSIYSQLVYRLGFKILLSCLQKLPWLPISSNFTSNHSKLQIVLHNFFNMKLSFHILLSQKTTTTTLSIPVFPSPHLSFTNPEVPLFLSTPCLPPAPLLPPKKKPLFKPKPVSQPP